MCSSFVKNTFYYKWISKNQITFFLKPIYEFIFSILIRLFLFLFTINLLMNISEDEGPKGIEVGLKAPDFTAIDLSTGNKINLLNLAKSNKGILLNFFRFAIWPYWNRHFIRVSKIADFFKEKGIIHIAIANDKPSSMKRMTKYKMSVIADYPKRKIVSDYNTLSLKTSKVDKVIRKVKISRPIQFLINSEGQIVWKYVGSKKDRPSNEELINAINKYI